jgi:adenylate kinase family enzyme
MKKVAIIGCGGSGKSHVSKRLGRALSAPVTHLDEVYYDDEWNPLSPEKFEALQRELVSAPEWVIDGNYNSTLQIRLEVCDTAVFLDLPTWQCLYGIFSRQVRHGAGQQAGGIYNRLTWNFVKYVAGYRRTMRPKVLAKLAEHAGHAEVVKLRSRRQVRRWLEKAVPQTPTR